MSDLESYSYEDGVTIGNEFLELVKAIDPKITKETHQFLSQDELAPIFSGIVRRARYGRPFPCIEGILSRILSREKFETPLCTVWGADEFWEMQSNCAPICEIPEKLGFVQFGDWCGRSDGDAWLIDTAYGKISAMYVGSGDSNEDEVRLSCYANFYSPWQWVSYLRCEAWEREWIAKPSTK